MGSSEPSCTGCIPAVEDELVCPCALAARQNTNINRTSMPAFRFKSEADLVPQAIGM
jgi:hypothetical protein